MRAYVLPGTPVRVSEQAKRAFCSTWPSSLASLRAASICSIGGNLGTHPGCQPAAKNGCAKVGGYQFCACHLPPALPPKTVTAARQMTKLRRAILQVCWHNGYPSNWISVGGRRVFYCIAPTFQLQLLGGQRDGRVSLSASWYFTWESRVGHEPG